MCCKLSMNDVNNFVPLVNAIYHLRLKYFAVLIYIYIYIYIYIWSLLIDMFVQVILVSTVIITVASSVSRNI